MQSLPSGYLFRTTKKADAGRIAASPISKEMTETMKASVDHGKGADANLRAFFYSQQGRILEYKIKISNTV